MFVYNPHQHASFTTHTTTQEENWSESLIYKRYQMNWI